MRGGPLIPPQPLDAGPDVHLGGPPRRVDRHLELATAAGRDPLCSYPGPDGKRLSRIHGLLGNTGLAVLLHASDLLPHGAIADNTPFHLHFHLKGDSEYVPRLSARSQLG